MLGEMGGGEIESVGCCVCVFFLGCNSFLRFISNDKKRLS